MGRKLNAASELLDGFDGDDVDELGSWLDDGPVPTRKTVGARPPARNHRRAIEELNEQRMLRSLLGDDLDAEFQEL